MNEQLKHIMLTEQDIKRINYKLECQRTNLLATIKYLHIQYINLSEYIEHVEQLVFDANNILDKYLREVGLTIEDINPDDFKEYQDETIKQCIEKFNKVRNQ